MPSLSQLGGVQESGFESFNGRGRWSGKLVQSGAVSLLRVGAEIVWFALEFALGDASQDLFTLLTTPENSINGCCPRNIAASTQQRGKHRGAAPHVLAFGGRFAASNANLGL